MVVPANIKTRHANLYSWVVPHASTCVLLYCPGQATKVLAVQSSKVGGGQLHRSGAWMVQPCSCKHPSIVKVPTLNLHCHFSCALFQPNKATPAMEKAYMLENSRLTNSLFAKPLKHSNLQCAKESEHISFFLARLKSLGLTFVTCFWSFFSHFL